jgi:hypothetical protein
LALFSVNGGPWSIRTVPKISGPLFDVDASRLKKARLQRLAKAMSLQSKLKTYLESKGNYDEDPEVKANEALDAGS